MSNAETNTGNWKAVLAAGTAPFVGIGGQKAYADGVKFDDAHVTLDSRIKDVSITTDGHLKMYADYTPVDKLLSESDMKLYKTGMFGKNFFANKELAVMTRAHETEPLKKGLSNLEIKHEEHAMYVKEDSTGKTLRMPLSDGLYTKLVSGEVQGTTVANRAYDNFLLNYPQIAYPQTEEAVEKAVEQTLKDGGSKMSR